MDLESEINAFIHSFIHRSNRLGFNTIRSTPPAHNNTTTMQCETKTHKIHKFEHKTVLKARTLYMFRSNYERLPESV